MVSAGLVIAAESGPITLSNLAMLAGALLLEAAIGYPGAVFRAIGHPVTWIGSLIGWLDRLLNRDDQTPWRRRVAGVASVLVVLAAAILPAVAVQFLLPVAVVAMLVSTLLASTLLASRSLWEHVAAVADGLRDGGLEGGRAAVSHIVGRNPQTLDEAAVVRAAIESLAENFSDGVVAPALWCAVAGLPGIAAYKAMNTADSMIGHRTPRHAAFGWAAARLDDFLNLPAARLSVLWLVLAAVLHRADAGGALRAVARDARRHRSPNAGWPEAAMAGALGLRLAGPRVYGAVRVDDPWMGDGRAEATPDDLRRALALYRTACGLQIGCVVVLSVLFW